MLRAAWETALDLVLPRTCPGCHAPVPWCDPCAATLTGRPRAVALPDAALDRLARAGLAAPPVHALTRYSGPVRAAVLAGKEHGRRDLPPLLGRALGTGLARLQASGVLPTELWLVPAPTRRSAARARGGDPVLAMARAAAAVLAAEGSPTGVARCLVLARGTRDSVGLDAAQRAANLAGRVRFLPRGSPPPGAAVVLLDDVLTSGATVTASLAALHGYGQRVVGALVLAAVPALRPAVLGVAPATSRGAREHDVGPCCAAPSGR
ncbi:MAG TPA: phosphoribosyltransferase family protein [Nakamurella sp.]|nr:phosphoribosyltransferase family protein [Nakamurella sp.]